jgi:hypothetical protein
LCFSSAGELPDSAGVVPGAGFQAEIKGSEVDGVPIYVSPEVRRAICLKTEFVEGDGHEVVGSFGRYRV